MEKITDSDYSQIVGILDNKIPQSEINKIITSVQKASDLQDFGDSPYTRPTFSKIALLIVLIISSIIWLIFPVYQILLSNESVAQSREQSLQSRSGLTNKDFAFNIEVAQTTTGFPEIKVFDRNGRELLGRADLINNQAFVVATKLNQFNLSTQEQRILTTSNVNLTEDIRNDVIKIINNNLNVKDTYMDFKPIDFGVDTLINVTN